MKNPSSSAPNLLFLSCLLALAPALDAAGTKVVYDKGESSVDGVSFMPRGIYGVEPGDMDRASGYGFNVIQTYRFSSMTDAQVADYLDAAQKRGLKVLFTLDMKNSPTVAKLAALRARVERFKSHPALYAWYLADEPSVKTIKPEELSGIYRRIKKTDPDHPVFSSNWELQNFKGTCDVDMAQLYSGPPSALRAGALARQPADATKYGVQWIGVANLFDTDFRACNVLGAETVSPAVIWNEAQEGKYDAKTADQKISAILKNLPNPPYKLSATFPDTPRKIRGQAFDFVAHGSNGLFYWLLQPEDSLNPRWGYYTIFLRPELREALKSALAELESLKPRIANPAVGSTTWFESRYANVFYWSRRSGDEVTVIAVNESEADWHEVRTVIPGLEDVKEAVATVSGENNRKIKIKNGVLSDVFQSNEAHVYLIDLK